MFAAESKQKKKVRHLARYSRDTKLAISELAPGQQRTVNGEKFEVGGLYFEYSRDKKNRAAPYFVEFDSKTSKTESLYVSTNTVGG